MEVQVNFLANDEYYNRCGGNPRQFVDGLYAEVLGRPARPGEVRNWLARLAIHRGNRLPVVQEFVNAAQIELNGRPQPPFPGPAPGPAPAAGPAPVDVANQLRAVAGQFIESINLELAGTRQGRALLIRGNSLVAACDTWLLVLSQGGAIDQHLGAIAGIEAALQAVQLELANPPGTAPASARVAYQLGQLLATGRAALSGQAGGAPPPVLTPEQQQQNQFMQHLASLSSESQQLAAQLRALQQQNRFYNGLLLSAEGFCAQVEVFRGQAGRGVDLPTLQASWQTLCGQADGIAAALRAGNALGPVQGQWWQIEQRLGQISELTRLPRNILAGPVVPPAGPVLPPAANPLAEVVQAAGRAVAEIDAFNANVAALVPVAPDVARPLADLRELRGAVLRLRVDALGGARPRQIRADLVQVAQLAQVAAARWEQVRRRHPLLPAPSADGIRLALDQLNALASG
jgi:hypothetical protein